MPPVWTRRRAGAAASPVSPVRQPVPDRPWIRLIELPLDWGPRSTQAWLIEAEPLTLIDTGVRSAASLAALEGALEGLGLGLGDLRRVVVTHAHRDHFGAVESLRRANPALECCAHEADAERIEAPSRVLRERLEARRALFEAHGVPEAARRVLESEERAQLAVEEVEAEATRVDRVLREGDRLAWKDGDLEVLHAPGHTPGHLLLHDPDAGLVFTGDLLMGQAIPQAEYFPLAGPPAPGDPLLRPPHFAGLRALRRSLRTLRGRPFKLLLPGYGGVVRTADRTLRDTLLHYDVRLQRIERGLRHLAAMGQPVTAWELRQALFPGEAAPADLHAQLLLVLGALDCLEEDGQLRVERRPDGVLTHTHV